MTERRWHEIWMEKCEDAETIRLRYDAELAFDYAVRENLLDFAEAAADHVEFAQALLHFVSTVRRMFTPEEMEAHLARTERRGAIWNRPPLKTGIRASRITGRRLNRGSLVW